MSTFQCGYCQSFSTGKILNPNRKKNIPVIKKCKTMKKEVEENSSSCKFFNPCDPFYCEEFNERKYMVICLQRRFNPNKRQQNNFCLTCRQFEQEVQPIIEKFYIEGEKPKNKPKKKGGKKKKNVKKLQNRRKQKHNRKNLKIRRKKHT